MTNFLIHNLVFRKQNNPFVPFVIFHSFQHMKRIIITVKGHLCDSLPH